MFVGIIIVLFFFVLVGTAIRWGYDSRDCIDSYEWERRSQRRSFI